MFCNSWLETVTLVVAFGFLVTPQESPYWLNSCSYNIYGPYFELVHNFTPGSTEIHLLLNCHQCRGYFILSMDVYILHMLKQ